MAAKYLLLTLAACAQPSEVVCGDGRICPEGTECVDKLGLRVLHDQLETCVGVADDQPCDLQGAPGGLCRSEVCIAARCGDGLITGSERCDGAMLGLSSVCSDLGYYNDTPLSCTRDCVYDTSQCG